MLPTFIIIGAAKSGTTSFYYQLRQHPDIFMPYRKELDFFIDDPLLGNWDKGITHYEAEFSEWQGQKAIGEASPRYTLSPALAGVPERMVRILPDVKLIYCMRNPIDQIWSFYKHNRFFSQSGISFETMLREDPFLYASANYLDQLQTFLTVYPQDQLLCLTFEEYVSDPTTTLNTICRFLGVENFPFPPDNAIQNSSTGRRVPRYPRLSARLPKRLGYYVEPMLMQDVSTLVMSPETRHQLLKKFEPMRAELEDLTGLDLSSWDQAGKPQETHSTSM